LKGKLRHQGIVVKDLTKAYQFYRKLGFKTHLKSEETWQKDQYYGGQVCKLKIMKLKDEFSHVIELIQVIQGEWKDHVAITLTEGTMNDLWEAFAEAGTLIAFKRSKGVEVMYLRDPSGNYVEVVKE
jgi:catechol 2,3-dioxygenase-like lactoylglutathione lyase family enzyme